MKRNNICYKIGKACKEPDLVKPCLLPGGVNTRRLGLIKIYNLHYITELVRHVDLGLRNWHPIVLLFFNLGDSKHDIEIIVCWLWAYGKKSFHSGARFRV